MSWWSPVLLGLLRVSGWSLVVEVRGRHGRGDLALFGDLCQQN